MAHTDTADTEALYRRSREELVSLSHSIVGCRMLAEDIVQDAFMRFSRQADAAGVDNPFPYIFRIVRNLSIDQLRRQDRERKIIETSAADADVEQVRERAANPETTLASKTDYNAFVDALDDLPVLTRRAVSMYLIEKRKLV
ncbi:MAG: sigma-70 family RNA polymerase sigma factor, partial [Pseudomonadota bacterium]